MALTEQQRADVRYYCGWSARFHQYDSRLEMAMNALATEPESEAQITGALTASPPGLLAHLKDIDARIRSAYERLKANKVGSIELNPNEIGAYRSQGRQLVLRICSILGVERRNDVFGSGTGAFASFDGPGGFPENYVGK